MNQIGPDESKIQASPSKLSVDEYELANYLIIKSYLKYVLLIRQKYLLNARCLLGGDTYSNTA